MNKHEEIIGLTFVVFVLAMITGTMLFIQYQPKTSNDLAAKVYQICEYSRKQINGSTEQQCADAQSITNTTYECNKGSVDTRNVYCSVESN